MGHLARDCTKVLTALVNQAPPNLAANRNLNQQGANTNRGGKGHETAGSQARDYALTSQQAQTSNNVVTSTLIVENLSIKVFFDPRATHSFISTDLVSKMGKLKKELAEMLLVSTPLGRILSANKTVEKCEIKIGETLQKMT